MRHRFPPRLGQLLLGLVLLAGLGGGPAVAEEAASPWFATDQGRVRLIAAEPAVDGSDAVRLGLQFELASHWKIYWRSPGDAGYPPHVDWKGSQNLAAASLAWPAPKRFSVLGLETVGYEGEVVLPITAKLERAGEALHAVAALQYLTCENICIPYEATLTLDLPAGAAPVGGVGFADLIDRFQAQVPTDGGAGGIRLQGLRIETGSKPVLALMLSADPPLAHPDAFVEGPEGVAFGAPKVIADDPRHPVLRLAVLSVAKEPPSLVGRPLTVTVVDGARALEASAIPTETPAPSELARLLPMLVAALIGGLILNFMPCVLPVLSLKLLAVVRHRDHAAMLRGGFVASAAGILAAFLGLAGAMIALRTAGVAVGWGVQFQEPIFLAAMAAVTTLFAANLWDLVEIRLPRWIADRAGGMVGGRSLIGNFVTGIFATLLATPCSAPFLGTAVGFALAGTDLDILVIFATLGFGLALPYLLVAAVPAVARLLPRPGRWMLVLRRVLGIALLGTAGWLIFVLSAEVGIASAVEVAVLLAVPVILLVALAASRLRAAGALLAILAALGAAAAAPTPAAVESVPADAYWQPFDRGRIATLVGEGKVVFVDVTARWCLTCQVNKRLVLDQPAVSTRLARPGVVAMQADWTRPDAGIADYLRTYGRYGIPFNVVYGPGAPSGIALSELLSAGDVLTALDRAKSDQPSAQTAGNGG
ncbi:MAG TPA: protein-disulfide reductase DsbD domain-containing protein [Stellaceae bacterium]|nr:protein-disulfide reductase DsbD domain-containing protein [Stellaceae bacterium]